MDNKKHFWFNTLNAIGLVALVVACFSLFLLYQKQKNSELVINKYQQELSDYKTHDGRDKEELNRQIEEKNKVISELEARIKKSKEASNTPKGHMLQAPINKRLDKDEEGSETLEKPKELNTKPSNDRSRKGRRLGIL